MCVCNNYSMLISSFIIETFVCCEYVSWHELLHVCITVHTSVNEWMCERMNEWMNERTNERTNCGVYSATYIERWTDTGGTGSGTCWMNEWMNEWILATVVLAGHFKMFLCTQCSNHCYLFIVEHHCKFLLLSFPLCNLAIHVVRLVLCGLYLTSQLCQLPMKHAFRHRLQHKQINPLKGRDVNWLQLAIQI